LSTLLHYEVAIRLGCFFAVLLAMLCWEWRRPRRTLNLPRARRWPANLGIVVVDSVVLRLAFPAAGWLGSNGSGRSGSVDSRLDAATPGMLQPHSAPPAVPPQRPLTQSPVDF
jgi:cytochrome b561